MMGLDGYLQRPNTCPDRAVPPDDEELSHTHTLVRVKNTTRIVPTVVTSRVHCAMGKNFSFSSRLRSIYYLWSHQPLQTFSLIYYTSCIAEEARITYSVKRNRRPAPFVFESRFYLPNTRFRCMLKKTTF